MPLREQIGSNYPRATAPRQHCQYDADGPLSNHQNGFAGREIHRLDTLHAGVDRFDERRLLEGDAFGNAHHAIAPHNPIHHANVVGKTSAAGFISCRRAHLLVSWALREHFMPAVITVAAGNVMEHHHAIANLKLFDAFAARRNYAGGLVSENAWRRMRTRSNFLQIGAADAAGMDAHQDLARPDLRNRNRLQADIVDAAIHRSLHGRGYRTALKTVAELGCGRHQSAGISALPYCSIRCSSS